MSIDVKALRELLAKFPLPWDPRTITVAHGKGDLIVALRNAAEELLIAYEEWSVGTDPIFRQAIETVKTLREQMDEQGVPNCAVWQWTDEDGKLFQIEMLRGEGKTPTQVAAEANAERDAAKAELAAEHERIIAAAVEVAEAYYEDSKGECANCGHDEGAHTELTTLGGGVCAYDCICRTTDDPKDAGVGGARYFPKYTFEARLRKKLGQ